MINDDSSSKREIREVQNTRKIMLTEPPKTKF